MSKNVEKHEGLYHSHDGVLKFIFNITAIIASFIPCVIICSIKYYSKPRPEYDCFFDYLYGIWNKNYELKRKSNLKTKKEA